MSPPAPGKEDTTSSGSTTSETRPARGPERVFIEREVKIRTFLGDRNADRVLGFEEDVRRAWRSISEADLARRLDVILDHVGPSVHLELSCHDAAIQKDPESLLQLIVKVFGESRSPHQLLRVLLDLHQQSDDVRSFSHLLKQSFDRLVARQKQLSMPAEPDTTLREQFVLGLRDVDLRRKLKEKVRQTPTVSFIALRDLALDYIEDTEGVSVSAAPVVADPTPSPMTQLLEQLVASNNQLMEANRQLMASHEEIQRKLSGFELSQARLQQQMTTINAAPSSCSPQTSSHGPPPQTASQGPFSRSQQKQQGYKKSMSCYGCGERGHFRRECPKARPQV